MAMKSIVSYPERGTGGNNKYRGNCSPKLIEDLIDHFRPSHIADYMVGGGTTEDVARAKGINSNCYDLHSGFDLMTMDIPERPSFIFWHPPYGSIITYSDKMYSAQDVIDKYGFDPRTSDLSRKPDWDSFVDAMNFCMLKQFTALEKGGRMAVLVGDVKKRGKLYSMILDIAKPGTIENILIKAQHNCWSDNQQYSGNFIPILHEYVLIVRKDNGLFFEIHLPRKVKADIRNMKNSTWRDIIASIMEDIGRPAELGEIYAAVFNSKRGKGYPTLKEKVRQTLQINPAVFQSVERGVWSLVA